MYSRIETIHNDSTNWSDSERTHESKLHFTILRIRATLNAFTNSGHTSRTETKSVSLTNDTSEPQEPKRYLTSSRTALMTSRSEDVVDCEVFPHTKKKTKWSPSTKNKVKSFHKRRSVLIPQRTKWSHSTKKEVKSFHKRRNKVLPQRKKWSSSTNNEVKSFHKEISEVIPQRKEWSHKQRSKYFHKERNEVLPQRTKYKFFDKEQRNT